MSVLIIAEKKDKNLKKISRELIAAAKEIGGPVIALLFEGDENDIRQLAASGADLVITHPLSEFNPQGYASVIAEVARQKSAKAILIPHSQKGKDYAGRVAVKLNAALVADVVKLKGTINEIEVKKPIYSGKAYANIKVATPAVITVRPNSHEPIESKGEAKSEISNVSEGNITSRLSGIELAAAAEIQLSDASLIVSGGRGIKGPENWPLLQELCNLLGAALGASRAAVDAGWISHSHQVGQTGKTVSPNCYIACGISGAVQHLAGMSSSRYIVAINKDPEAPIFKIATYGIVDDLFKVVPALTAELKKTLGQ